MNNKTPHLLRTILSSLFAVMTIMRSSGNAMATIPLLVWPRRRMTTCSGFSGAAAYFAIQKVHRSEKIVYTLLRHCVFNTFLLVVLVGPFAATAAQAQTLIMTFNSGLGTPITEPVGTYSEDGILLTANSYYDGITTAALGTPTPSFYFDGQNGDPPMDFNAYAEFSLVDGANFTLESLDLKTNGFANKTIVTSVTGTFLIGDPLALTTITFSGPAYTDITWFKIGDPGGFATQLDNITVVVAPEPASIGLMGVVLAGMLMRRRRNA